MNLLFLRLEQNIALSHHHHSFPLTQQVADGCYVKLLKQGMLLLQSNHHVFHITLSDDLSDCCFVVSVCFLGKLSPDLCDFLCLIGLLWVRLEFALDKAFLQKNSPTCSRLDCVHASVKIRRRLVVCVVRHLSLDRTFFEGFY